ncbi:Golgi-associated RAB2 interactor protein 5B isoform X2 [Notamacropus eugenii]|uniref:Golgi-associated RAB2 interactor protein 5B isoform X2 n=1 Tax=Notamacropus eugenii TaxID=9315 RepID=UPI003B66C730
MEHSFQPWVPLLGHLQRTMMEGEYLPLGPLLPMFESDFLQVTNQGEAIFLHKKENPVTMGVAYSIPGLMLPDLILLARPVGNKKQKELELTRLLPTHLARLFVHNVASWRLKLRLASGRSFYLRLDADQREGCFLFNRWRYLVYLLQGPVPSWAPQAYQAQLSPASKLKAKTQKMSQAGSTTLKAKEMMSRAVGDSLPFMTQLEPPGRKGEEKKTQGEEEGQPTVTIWTLFSIISNTLNRPKASKEPTPRSSSSGLSGMEPCVTPCQTSSSWLGSHRPSKKIFHSSSTFLDSGSQSRIGFSMTWENIHPHKHASFKTPSIVSHALAWASSLRLNLKQTKAVTESEEAAELPYMRFMQQEDKSLLAEKQSHPKSTPYESTEMSHLSTKASLYLPTEDSPDHFIKAPEPSPSSKAPEPSPSPKAPEPSPSPKAPEPSPSPKAPEPSPSPKAPEPSPSPKAPEPSPSPKGPDSSPSPKALEPLPSPKGPDPSSYTKTTELSGSTKTTPEQSTKTSPKHSKKSTFLLSTKASPKHSKKSTFLLSTKASPKHSKKSAFHPFTKDSKAHPIKTSVDQGTKASDRSPSNQSLGSTAVSLTLYTPDSTSHSKEASPYLSTKASPKHSKKSAFHLSTKASSKHSKKSAFHPFSKDSKAHPIKASADQATKASVDQVTKSSERSPSKRSLGSTAVSLSLYTPDSTSHSKEAKSYLSTKASPKYSKSAFHLFTKASSKHSKKSSFHPTTKASPHHFTKDSKSYPIKASADQVTKSSERSPSKRSFGSTAVSLYTPDSTRHSKEASSDPSTKALSHQSKKTSQAPSNKA